MKILIPLMAAACVASCGGGALIDPARSCTPEQEEHQRQLVIAHSAAMQRGDSIESARLALLLTAPQPCAEVGP